MSVQSELNILLAEIAPIPFQRPNFEKITPVPPNISEIIQKMKNAQQWISHPQEGDDWSALDMSFLNRLAYWCNNDRTLMDHVFRESSLYRPKWDERHGILTYGELTINKVILSPRTSSTTHPDDYRSAKNGDYEVIQRIEIESKEQLLAALLAMSTVPKPAVSACKSDIAFYGVITMIYGEAKMGKSFTCANAIEDSLGLFIDIDNNGEELHKHLLLKKITPLHGSEAKPFIDMLLRYDGAEKFIVVIDSFANYADELGFNVNDTTAVTKLFKEIRKITDKGHAVVLIHHVTTNGKTGDEYSSKIQGNAGAIFGRVDITYRLESRGVLIKDRSRISNAADKFISSGASSGKVLNHVEVPA